MFARIHRGRMKVGYIVRNFSSSGGPHVAVVGAGPAGFYAAQHISKARPDVTVDIYEKLPVPFGLVRFGVAPDHPDVKNCITTFTKTAELPNVNFIGNTALGRDVSLGKLLNCYNSVLLTYGAAEDRLLGVPGESLNNILPARSVVSCYNGLPGSQDLDINLDTDTVAVVGVGNVSVDLARMILTPVDVLRQYDTSEAWLEKLTKSRVKRVVLLGRRGPLHVSFTIAELRELIKLPGVRTKLHPTQFQPLQAIISSLPRPRKRLVELLVKTALGPHEASWEQNWQLATKEWELRLLRSPLEFLPSETDGGAVGKVVLAVNEAAGDEVVEVGREELECGLVLRSIGYKSLPVDPELPFNPQTGIVPNQEGRVLPGLYAAGWLATGPRGVIVTTMNGAFKVAAKLVEDLDSSPYQQKPGRAGLNLPNSITWQDWLKIDKAEELAGQLEGRPRMKLTTVEDMLAVIRG